VTLLISTIPCSFYTQLSVIIASLRRHLWDHSGFRPPPSRKRYVRLLENLQKQTEDRPSSIHTSNGTRTRAHGRVGVSSSILRSSPKLPPLQREMDQLDVPWRACANVRVQNGAWKLRHAVSTFMDDPQSILAKDARCIRHDASREARMT